MVVRKADSVPKQSGQRSKWYRVIAMPAGRDIASRLERKAQERGNFGNTTVPQALVSIDGDDRAVLPISVHTVGPSFVNQGIAGLSSCFC